MSLTVGDPERSRSLNEIWGEEYVSRKWCDLRYALFISTEEYYEIAYWRSRKGMKTLAFLHPWSRNSRKQQYLPISRAKAFKSCISIDFYLLLSCSYTNLFHFSHVVWTIFTIMKISSYLTSLCCISICYIDSMFSTSALCILNLKIERFINSIEHSRNKNIV